MKELSLTFLGTLIGCHAAFFPSNCWPNQAFGIFACPWGTKCVFNNLVTQYQCVGLTYGTQNNACIFGRDCDAPLVCQPSTKICKTSQDIAREACLELKRKPAVVSKDGYQTIECVDANLGTQNNQCIFGQDCDAPLECQQSTQICKTSQDIEREACLDATRTVMVAIKDNYQTTGVTTRSAKVADTLMVLDDFSTNAADNLAYKYACTDKGGAYVELHYNATCEALAVGGGKNKTAKIFVAGQPRCYSNTCDQQSFGQDLLNEFSLRPTEDRADLDSHSTEKWTCTGTFRTPSVSICNDISTSINKTRGIEIATLGMKPVIQVQKTLGLVKEEKLLTFTGHDPARFNKTCEVSGGLPYDADGRLVCGDSKFDVRKYPTCLWPLCGGVGSDESETFIESLLHDRLVASGQIKNKTSCNFSSALRLHVSASSGAFVAMIFMTIGFMSL